MKKASKLITQERDLIAVWLGQEVSIRQTATRLKRSPSTVAREIERNSFYDQLNERKYYVAIHAQAKTQKRKSLAGRRHPLKNQAVYAYVLGKIRAGWSPEQIAGRLRRKYGETVICHETIYRFIYVQENQDRKLWEYLPWKRKKRKRKSGRKVHRGQIPNRVSIRQRQEVVNKRLVFGHWEGDTLEGKKINKDGIHTEAERLSRMTKALKLKTITSQETVKAQEEIFSPFPRQARKSTTLDNGRENHLHSRLTRKLGMKTYFADPYSAWQKGTVEHHNGLIRRYLPKGTDFSKLTQEELDDIVEEINNRPRKVLNYNTPKEVFESYLKSSGVAIQL